LFVALVLVLLPQSKNFLQYFYVEALSFGLVEDFFLTLTQLLEFFLDAFDAFDEGQNTRLPESPTVSVMPCLRLTGAEARAAKVADTLTVGS
jgi:hypothetical protein